MDSKEAQLWKAYVAAHGADVKPIGPDAAGGQ
jgi:hypothetical protein